MFEIIGLVVAVTAIAALARGRGASPVVMGSVTVAGWALIEFGGMFLVPKGTSPYPLMLGSMGLDRPGRRIRALCDWRQPAQTRWQVELFQLPLPEQRKFGHLRGLSATLEARINGQSAAGCWSGSGSIVVPDRAES